MDADRSGASGDRGLPRPEPVGVTQPDGVLLALTTVGSREQADAIARTLVEERLAACVNLLAGCSSVYRWQGAIEQADETLLVVKTTRKRWRDFEARLRELHPYELPEILAVAPDAVLPAYASWVIAETRRRFVEG